MQRFTVGRGSRWVLGAFGMIFIAIGVVGGPLLWRAGERLAALGLVLVSGAIALWALREVWRWSRLSWVVSEGAIEQCEAGAEPIRMRWEDVEGAQFSSLRGALRVRSRDRRGIDVPYHTGAFDLLVLEVERAVNRHRSTALPMTIAPGSTWGARWTIAVAVLVGCVALVPSLSMPVRAVTGMAAVSMGCAGLLWWVVARNPAGFAFDAERLTVRQGWSTDVFELRDLRGWAVGFMATGWGAGHSRLWLATDDDAWMFVVPSGRWLELAGAFRAAAALHPSLEWLPEPHLSGEDVVDDHEAPATPAPAERPARRWLWLALFAVATLTVVVAAAATSAPPGASALERARMASAARLPAFAINALEPWLDQHPRDLAAHRALVDAHLARCRDAKSCREREARARYESLRASEDPILAELGTWALARIEGARGDRERAIAALADIDADVIPHAPVDRARLLSAAGRRDEAARALRGALDGPARAEAEEALARLLVKKRDVGELSALLDELGVDLAGGAPARVLAAHSLRVDHWAALHGRNARRAPLPLLAALVFAIAWVWLARSWGGALAPSRAASIAAAAVGAGLFVIEAFARDAMTMAGPLFGADLGVVPLAVLCRIALPFTLALAWSGAAPSTPLGLVSRAGCISAGAGVAWALDWMLAGHSSGTDVAFAWSLLPVEILLAPWAALLFTDLRAREWSPTRAWASALALASIAYGAATAIGVLWAEGRFQMTLVLLVAIAITFRPLLGNAAVLSREPGAAPPGSASLAYLGLSMLVLAISWVGLTRELNWSLALRAMMFPAVFVIIALVLAGMVMSIPHYPKWRRDWWRTRPGEDGL